MAPSAGGYFWNDDRVEQLKSLFADGLSCSQIARKMGGITRNAVIGKVHRLGLTGLASPSRIVRPRLPKLAPVPRREVEPPAPVIELPPLQLEGGTHVTVMTVNDRMCRWPFGDPQDATFHFCGQAPRASSPYCEAHARKAYQPQQTNKTAANKAYRDSGIGRTGLG